MAVPGHDLRDWEFARKYGLPIKQVVAPKADADKTEHWQRNHEITRVTLDEDFVIGERMQSTLLSGANKHMLFGRIEGALDHFNRTIEAHLNA